MRRAGPTATGARPPARPPSWVRPEVRRLRAYHLERPAARFKLDQNEVPWDLPRRLKEEVVRRLSAEDWARYPDFHSDGLRRALGRLHGHPWQGILAGSGSGELLGLALDACVQPGGEVLGAVPSFDLYETLVCRAGGRCRFLGPTDDLRLPLDELEAEIDRDPRRPVILCSPNNPTGDAVEPARLEAWLGRLEAPLLLDNAYGEFCRHDYRPLLARHPNLLLFRTLSKAWSLAGVRVGYLLADPAAVAELLKAKLPYNLGLPAVVAAEVALAAGEVVERRVRLVLGRRAQWAAMLAARGFGVHPSEANFLLVRCPEGVAARELQGALAARDILVRAPGHPALAGHLRFSVGSGPALRAAAAALGEILSVRNGGDR